MQVEVSARIAPVPASRVPRTTISLASMNGVIRALPVPQDLGIEPPWSMRTCVSAHVRMVLALLVLLFGGNALAVCTVTGTGTLANLDAGDQVECTGATNGETIAGAADGIQVSLADDFTNSSVSISGSAQIPTTRVDFAGNTNAAGSTVTVVGSNARINVDGVAVSDISGLSLTENSFSQSSLNIVNGSSLSLASGSSVLLNGNAALDLSSIGTNSLIADSSSNAAATVIGDAGNQTLRLLGTANAGASGVLADLGAGDDVVTLSIFSNVSGLIDAGAGAGDRLLMLAGTLSNPIDGFEILETGNGQTVRIAALDDFSEVRANGAVFVESLSYLGLPSATITMSGNGRIVYDAPGGFETLTQTLVSTGSLFNQQFEIDTSGELVVATNSAAFEGNWRITNGTLTIDPSAELGTGLIINNDQLIAGSASLPVTISNDISGTGSFEVIGGLVTLTGDNTYSGGTLVQRATLSVQDTQALGTGVINFNGGGAPATSVLQLDVTSGTQTLANTMTGSGSLVVQGGGELVLTSSSTFAGITNIAADTDLIAASDSALGTSSVQNDGRLGLIDAELGNTIGGAGNVEAIGSGVSRLSGSNTYTGGTSVVSGTLAGQVDAFGSASISVASDASLLVESAASQGVTLQNDVTGSGRLISNSVGLISLAGTNDYSGGTAIDSGTLAGTVASFGTGGIEVADDATLLVGSISTGNETLQNVVSGDGGLQIDSTGTITLAGANSFSGGTQVSNGTLTGEVGAFGSGAIDLAVDASLLLASAASATLNNVVSGDGGVDIQSSGTVTLAAVNTYAGGTMVGSGVLAGAVDAFGTGAIDLTSDASLLLTQPADGTLSNLISGDGSLDIQTAGTVTLAGANTYAGGTTVASGVLAGASDAFGAGVIELADDTSLLLVQTGSGALSNVVTGNGSLDVQSTGTVTLAAANSHTGGTTVSSGVLSGATDAFGTGAIDLADDTSLRLVQTGSGALGNVVSGNGSLDIQSSGTVTLAAANTHAGGTSVGSGVLAGAIDAFGTGEIDLAADASLLLTQPADGTLSNLISGDGSLDVQTAGTVTLAGANTYAGGTTVGSGLLSGASDAFGTGAIDLAANTTLLVVSAADATFSNAVTGDGSLVVDGVGVLDIDQALSHTSGTRVLNGSARVTDLALLGSGGLNIAPNGSVILNNGVDQAVALSLSGSGTFVKTGSATATFSAANAALTGAVDIQAGRVELQDSAGLGRADISIGSGGSLELSLASDSTFANTLDGAGGLVKSGVASLTLSGPNTSYSGDVLVAGGTLIGGAANFGSGSIEIANDAEVQVQASGNQTLANALTGAGVARLTGAGMLEVTGANSVAGLIVETEVNSRLSGLGQSTRLASGGRLNLTLDSDASNIELVGDADSTLAKLGTGALTFDQAATLGNLDIESGRVVVNDELTLLGANGLSIAADGELLGSGTVVGDVSNDGLLAAGNSIGTLTIDGDYTHGSGATMQVEFDSTSIDLLQVSGTATINGGDLELLSLDNTEGSGMTFLVADGGVSGSFANVTLDGANSSVVYSPGSVGLPDTMVALMARPSSLNSQITAATEAINIALSARQGLPVVRGESMAWGYIVAGSQQRDRQDDALGFDVDSRGIAGGVEWPVGESRYHLGMSITNITGESDLDGGAGDGEVDSDLLAIYAGFGNERLNWRLGLTTGQQSWESARLTSMNQVSEFISSDTEASVFGLAGHIAMPMDLGNWQMNPQLDLRYVSIEMDGYGEDGLSDLALVVASETFKTGYAAAGVDAQRRFELGNGRSMTTNVDLALARVFPMDKREIDILFRNSAMRSQLDADAKARNQVEAGASFTWNFANSVGLTLGYDVSIGQGDTRHQAHAAISASF